MAKQGKYSGKLTNTDLLFGMAVTWACYQASVDTQSKFLRVCSVISGGAVVLGIVDRYLGDGFP